MAGIAAFRERSHTSAAGSASAGVPLRTAIAPVLLSVIVVASSS
jgi:hypothetical protein